MVTPFHPATTQLKNILDKHWNTLESSTLEDASMPCDTLPPLIEVDNTGLHVESCTTFKAVLDQEAPMQPNGRTFFCGYRTNSAKLVMWLVRTAL